MKEIKTINFVDGNVAKNLIQLFIPLMVAFFFSMAFDINDSIWIGNMLGETALAAQTVSMPVIMMYNAACIGITGGIGILVSHAIGGKRDNEMAKITATSFWTLLVVSVVIGVFCELGIDRILSVIGTPTEIYTMAKHFLMIHILSFPFVMMYMYFCAILRSCGNSSIQLFAIIGCTLINVLLDPLFILKMGMTGVAWATVISEGIMMIIVFAFCKKNNVIQVSPKLFDLPLLNKIIQKAVPSMIQQSIPSLSMAFITSTVANFGVIPIAAYGASTKIETILLYPSMAMNMALAAAAGQCFGAGNQKKVSEYLKKGIQIGVGLLLVLSVMVALFSKTFSLIFGIGYEARKIVGMYFAIIAIGYVFNMATNSLLGTINGMGKPTSAMVLMIFYYIVVRMPLAKVLSETGLGLKGVWIAVLLSHIAATIAAVCYYKKSQRNIRSSDHKSE